VSGQRWDFDEVWSEERMRCMDQNFQAALQRAIVSGAESADSMKQTKMRAGRGQTRSYSRVEFYSGATSPAAACSDVGESTRPAC
jgi:hypothetical protein